jgi:hypothetical protein
MKNQRTQERMSHWDDPEQVVHLSFEAAGGKRELAEGRYRRSCPIESQLKLYAPIRWPGNEDIYDAKRGGVVVRCHGRKPETRRKQRGGGGYELVGTDQRALALRRVRHRCAEVGGLVASLME